MVQEPTINDLRQYMRNFHDWYFGEDAGGMFLTAAAKDIYMRLLNLLAETAYSGEGGPDSEAHRPLSATESQTLRELASELRHQLAEDVGAANPPPPTVDATGSTAPTPRHQSLISRRSRSCGNAQAHPARRLTRVRFTE
jgi:hypothetical protein